MSYKYPMWLRVILFIAAASNTLLFLVYLLNNGRSFDLGYTTLYTTFSWVQVVGLVLAVSSFLLALSPSKLFFFIESAAAVLIFFNNLLSLGGLSGFVGACVGLAIPVIILIFTTKNWDDINVLPFQESYGGGYSVYTPSNYQNAQIPPEPTRAPDPIAVRYQHDQTEEKLEKLKDLKDKGLISDEDYQKKSKK